MQESMLIEGCYIFSIFKIILQVHRLKKINTNKLTQNKTIY